MLGLAKVGLAGVGSLALALPLMVLAIDPVQAAAIMLPILIVQDIVSVWSFRHHLDWYVLGWTLPGATVGILIGYLVAASVSASAVMALVGTISIAFGAHRLWLGRRGTPAVGTNAPAGPDRWPASRLVLLAKSPMQVRRRFWVIPRRLARDVLLGTSDVYLATMN